MRRVGRPPLGARSRQLIAIRVDPDVLAEFRKEARRRRVGSATRCEDDHKHRDTDRGERAEQVPAS